jgi:hypothetical protein
MQPRPISPRYRAKKRRACTDLCRALAVGGDHRSALLDEPQPQRHDGSEPSVRAQPTTNQGSGSMFKTKLLVGLVALMTALVVVTAPAYAEFEATTNTTSGAIKTFPEKTVFKTVTEGPSIECKSASGEPAGVWAIQVKQKRANETQEQTKKGPHLLLQIKKWGTCTGPTGIAAKVTCSLQIEQGSRFGNTGSVYPPGCEVFIGTEATHCIVKVANAGNKELSSVTLTKLGVSEVEIGSNVAGTTSTITETNNECTILTVKAGSTGEFKTNKPLIVSGITLV